MSLVWLSACRHLVFDCLKMFSRSSITCETTSGENLFLTYSLARLPFLAASERFRSNFRNNSTRCLWLGSAMPVLRTVSYLQHKHGQGAKQLTISDNSRHQITVGVCEWGNHMVGKDTASPCSHLIPMEDLSDTAVRTTTCGWTNQQTAKLRLEQ